MCIVCTAAGEKLSKEVFLRYINHNISYNLLCITSQNNRCSIIAEGRGACVIKI